jgi:hypothetical protein
VLEAAADAELPLRDALISGGRLTASVSLLNEPDLGPFRARVTTPVDFGVTLETGLAEALRREREARRG